MASRVVQAQLECATQQRGLCTRLRGTLPISATFAIGNIYEASQWGGAELNLPYMAFFAGHGGVFLWFRVVASLQ
jgi:hypothetical protein